MYFQLPFYTVCSTFNVVLDIDIEIGMTRPNDSEKSTLKTSAGKKKH